MKTCPQCERAFEPKRPHGVYCSEPCQYQGWVEKQVEAAQVGAQCIEQHPLAEVRAEQEQIAAKARWALIVREHIARTLLETGFVHSDDLDSLGIPDEHRNIAGSQMGGFVQRGLMVEVGRRASIKPSRKKAKSAIYRITDKGRRELTIGVSASESHGDSSQIRCAHSGGQTAGVGPDDRRHKPGIRQPVRVDPGEQTAHREGTPHSQEPARPPMPVPSASSPSGGSGVVEETAPESARELQRGREPQVRGQDGRERRDLIDSPIGGCPDSTRGLEKEPARLFEPAPERPLSPWTSAEAA